MDNLWANAGTHEENVWGDNSSSISVNNDEIDDEVEETYNENITPTESSDENDDDVSEMVNVEDSANSVSVWAENADLGEHTDNIWVADLNIEHISDKSFEKIPSIETNKVGQSVIRPSSNENTDDDEQHIEEEVSNFQDDDNDDDDADFGDFEEIAEITIEFGKPIESIISQIFPNSENRISLSKEDINKSCFLLEGGNKPMKCYNTITASNRQFFIQNLEVMNTHQRGCMNKSITQKELVSIANDWVFSDKGFHREGHRKSNSQLWDGNDQKNNIFRWSSKIEKNEKENENIVKVENKPNISQKLLNSAYMEARKLIDKRLDQEKEERIALETLRKEREKRLREARIKKEEEMAKYKLENGDKVTDSKKKGFFGKMFQGKSKISKDHISHTKIASPEADQVSNDHDLSLKEMMEKDGYTFSSTGNKKHGFRNRKGHVKDNKIDDDDDDDENDDDDDNNVNFQQNYGLLTETVSDQVFEENFQNDDHDLFGNNINEEFKELDEDKIMGNKTIESTSHKKEQAIQKSIDNNKHDMGDDYNDNEFGEFAEVDEPTDSSNQSFENSNRNNNTSGDKSVNLIDL